jgi:hypothetical protein
MNEDKCGLCGAGFLTGEIPYTGLCNDTPYHRECYIEHYAAIEYEPEACVQSRHRNG